MPANRPDPRRPLDADWLAAQVIRPGGFVTDLQIVAETDSTNADLLAAAAQGAPAGTVRVAQFQRSGRGRFDRTWVSPAGAGLTVSVIVRPDEAPPGQWGWLPLLTGLAVRSAVQSVLAPSVAGQVQLKWPNDLLLGPDGAKAAGILVQAAGGAAVIGIGLNVDHTADELPTEQATSLRLAFPAASVDRADLLTALLNELGRRYARWIAAGGDAESSGLREEYRSGCDTLGRTVRVQQADGDLFGVASSIDANGSLVVGTVDGTRVVSAGDVVHLRPGER